MRPLLLSDHQCNFQTSCPLVSFLFYTSFSYCIIYTIHLKKSTINPIPIEFQSLFRYEERWQVLIYFNCGHSVTSKGLIKYLHGIHQIKEKEYSPLTQGNPEYQSTSLQAWRHEGKY